MHGSKSYLQNKFSTKRYKQRETVFEKKSVSKNNYKQRETKMNTAFEPLHQNGTQ